MSVRIDVAAAADRHQRLCARSDLDSPTCRALMTGRDSKSREIPYKEPEPHGNETFLFSIAVAGSAIGLSRQSRHECLTRLLEGVLLRFPSHGSHPDHTLMSFMSQVMESTARISSQTLWSLERWRDNEVCAASSHGHRKRSLCVSAWLRTAAWDTGFKRTNWVCALRNKCVYGVYRDFFSWFLVLTYG